MTKYLTRDESRNPGLKAEARFCLHKSWKAEGRAFGPLARLLFLQSSAFNLLPDESYENGRLIFLFFMTDSQE
jgi:hypothetical protein